MTLALTTRDSSFILSWHTNTDLAKPHTILSVPKCADDTYTMPFVQSLKAAPDIVILFITGAPSQFDHLATH